MAGEKIQIARLTWQRFRNALRLLVRSNAGPKAMMLCGFLGLCMVAINGLNVVNSYVGRDFMSAIENRDMSAFQYKALIYIGVFILSTVAAVFYRFSEERLGVLWREQLTKRLMDVYLSDRTYYRLDSSTGVANPDQRITDDVRAFTTTTLSFTLLILNGTLTVISFSGVLWTISPQLFGVAVLYAICGTLLTIFLGRPLIRLNYYQLDMEANFRSDLIHVRENSESIALAHREGRFKARLNRRLDYLTKNFRRLIRINRNLGFFTTLYNYMIQIIPALIVAPMFISGGVNEFGVITQSAMAFAALLGAFSLIVTQFQSISAFTAVTARLYQLSDAMERAQGAKEGAIEIRETSSVVRYEGLTLYSADKSRLLVSDLNLELPSGSRWLITGVDDAPKVALFRATASVWEYGGGRISRPSLDDILFLPERPYLPPGTLHEVLLRTGMESRVRDSVITKVMANLGLSDVLSRAGGLDAEQDWDDLLSIGEQHLLSVARIFLAKPAFVFLDRPGSAMPKNQISIILDQLKSQGIGVVVLSKNGESRLKYDAHLEILENGAWVVRHEESTDSQVELSDLNC